MGPNHNGTLSGEKLGNIAIRKVWETNVGTGFSSITVVGNRAYTMGNRDNTDTIYCLNSDRSGEILWTYSYPCKLDPNQYEGGPNTTPTYHNQKIYVLSKEGHIFCLEAEKGKVVWSAHTKDFGITPPGFGFSGSPVIHGNLLLLNVGTGGAALKKNTGEIIWKSESKGDDKCYATPFPFSRKGKDAYAFFVGEKLLTIDPLTGSQYWQIPWKSTYNVHTPSPTFFNNKVFVSAGHNKKCSLFDVTGDKPKIIWENKNMHNDFLNSIYHKGYLYGIDGAASRRAKLVCLDAATGNIQWKNTDIGFGSLLLIDEKLIILNDKGTVFIAEANSNKYVELAHKEILKDKCWTPPAVVGGRLYARNAPGDLVCINLTQP